MPEATAIDTSTIPRREPVLTAETAVKFQKEKINKQWSLITERMKRDAQSQKSVRDALVSFTATPVSETLADQALQAVSVIDPKVYRLAEQYEETLGDYTKLPAVPDEALVPDITYSANFQSPEQLVQDVSRYADAESTDREVQRWQENGWFMGRATTKQEKKLVAARYRFARDVKVLALGAELLSQDPPVSLDNGRCTLPSGIKIAVDPGHLADASVFLSPLTWEKRIQMKDRVYEIAVGGKKYLLKEQKTARHTDTKKHGHQPTNPSQTEFAVARYMNEHGGKSEGDVSLLWEKPVGFVTYPDGYQFTIFEFEEGLKDYTDTYFELQNDIIHNPEKYKEDFEEISQLVNPDPKDLPEPQGSKARRTLTFWKKPHLRTLAIHEYAWIKANYMIQQARDFYADALSGNNIDNSDHDGFLYRVKKDSNSHARLEIVGFDYEYFRKSDPQRIREVQERREQFRRQERERGDGVWYNPVVPSELQKKAYWAYEDLQREKLAQAGTEKPVS